MSREQYYTLGGQLERQVGASLFTEAFDRLLVAGSSERLASFRGRFAAALTAAGFRIEPVEALEELPGDAAREDVLLLLAQGTLPEALPELSRLRFPLRSILILDDPSLLTMDLPILFRAGVLDVLGQDASVDELLGVLQRIGQTASELPAGLIAKISRCSETLQQSRCLEALAEPARSRIQSRIEALTAWLAAARKFYFALD